jgi:thiamine biosynthesis lipoprotein
VNGILPSTRSKETSLRLPSCASVSYAARLARATPLRRGSIGWILLFAFWLLSPAGAEEPLVLAGAAMGTTYRVTLATEAPGLGRGEVHREIEVVLARIDAAASTWRDDSDASRFNRAAMGEWVEVGDDLARLVEIARQVHAATDGAFDITVGPLGRLWREGREPTAAEMDAARNAVGMELVESRPAAAGRPAALRKSRDGVLLDLGGIGPGYAVDAIGERLLQLGSEGHLVELGGEARAWGDGPDGRPWRVAVRRRAAGEGPAVVELAAGEAIAFATRRPGRSPVDPRTGRPPAAGDDTVMARAGSCAVADALAVARAIRAE